MSDCAPLSRRSIPAAKGTTTWEETMIDKLTSRRAVIKGALGLAAAAVAGRGPPRAAADAFGPPELIEAAKQEGSLVYYTANFAEVERQVIAAFNKRFPFVKVEIVRAPGGQLITRGKTEAAARKPH